MKSVAALIYLSIILIFSGIILFWDKGYIDYSAASHRNDSLYAVLDSVEQANILLEAEIDSVEKKIPFKMEKIAREKYSMLKPGEQLLIIKSEK